MTIISYLSNDLSKHILMTFTEHNLGDLFNTTSENNDESICYVLSKNEGMSVSH